MKHPIKETTRPELHQKIKEIALDIDDTIYTITSLRTEIDNILHKLDQLDNTITYDACVYDHNTSQNEV